MTDALADSFAAADEIARKAAKNFYSCFRILPRRQRDATVALYAFLRALDDIADGDLPIEEKRQRLAEWRRIVEANGVSKVPWGLAFHHVVEEYHLPKTILREAINGVAWDLDRCSCRNFAELYEYCYGVASTAGLLSIRVWGATDPAADLPAEWLGVAFQLTNILRDLSEDQRSGRCYLPADDMARFDVAPTDLGGPPTREIRNLIQFEAARAEDYFNRGSAVVQYLPGPGKAVVKALIGVYRSLLQRIQRDPSAVFAGRVSAPRIAKLRALLFALPYRWR